MVRSIFASLVIIFVSASYSLAAGDTVTYEKDIKKILGEKCMCCHGAGSPLMEEFDKNKDGFKKKITGPRFDTYSNLMVVVNGSDAGALMRRLDDGENTKDGMPGNMFQNLGCSAEERAANLGKIKKWVGSWNLKKRKELAEDELKAITAPER
ncbi:MAG: cytochrome C [Nitrospirae bacterium]|nr:cytochrome C [Nitrospirota bacterium]